MKKFEKIILVILLAALIGRMCGLLWCRAFFVLASWLLSLAYLLWGYQLLRRNANTPTWLSIAAGIAFATSLAILPFITFVRHELIFKLLPLPNLVLLLTLLTRFLRDRRKGRSTFAEGLLRLRSLVLLVCVAPLAYMPPHAALRTVIIALNRGDEQLLANMDMIAASEAYDEAMATGDCAAALKHAEHAYKEGRIWLFGNVAVDYMEQPARGPVDFGHGFQFNVDSAVRVMQAQREQQELEKIGKTLDHLYDANRCLGQQAESAGDPVLAYMHYRAGDSLYNLIERTEGYGQEERAWSKRNMARAASDMGEYDTADSLFNTSMDLYKEAMDTVDADGAWILADWARSMAKRRQWRHSNYLLRVPSA